MFVGPALLGGAFGALGGAALPTAAYRLSVPWRGAGEASVPARRTCRHCEQPLPSGDPDGPELKRRAPLPIFVDEDCHTLADVPACAERAHGLTVKLAKSGGIREAVRIAHAGRALGLGLMLGCMNESGLAVSAGAQIASLFDHVDLDGNLLLAEDPWPGVELVDGVQLPPDAPGLGVRHARETVP